ncbi:hypothetical protein [Fluviispira multicolorata]|uniref:Ribosomal protein L11 methyltransferase (PrmA) n=1 Tax=Fluviispira multicolorata TaxID=2654512 RepID=A0A833JD34_9BACT|nr:hypothetical protein [Fluviispira multicolorata]KAB8028002.1 hypothetical protein GCL57_13180 [Fluviispira multicolorata]
MKEELRFAFGKNWTHFLTHLTDDRIHEASLSLLDFLNIDNLKNMSFLDVGSGSGLFSFAAKMNRAKVSTIDYDTDSALCT